MGYKIKGLLDTLAIVLAAVGVYLVGNGYTLAGVVIGAFVAGFKVFIEKLAEDGLIEAVGRSFKIKKIR